MIRGLALRGKRREAFQLYEEKVKPADMPVDIETYNALMSCTYGVPNKPPLAVAQDLCRDMERNGVSPNHQTFIHIASIPARFSKTQQGVMQHAQKIMNEMEYLGLQPCISV